MAIDINYLAILVAGIVNMVLGFLWYGPIFGKKWMGLMGITPQGKSMTKEYVLTFIGALVMAYVFFHYVAYYVVSGGRGGVSIGLLAGFWAWLGFVAPVLLGKVLWENKSWSLWVLDAGYYLVLLLINGAILASWM